MGWRPSFHDFPSLAELEWERRRRSRSAVVPQSFSRRSTFVHQSFHSRSAVVRQSFSRRSSVIQPSFVSHSAVVRRSFTSRSAAVH